MKLNHVLNDKDGNCLECKPQHTPTPWTAFPQYGMFAIMDSLNRTVVRTPADTDEKYDSRSGSPYTKEAAEANAAFIVRAVNSHEELVAQLKKDHFELFKNHVYTGTGSWTDGCASCKAITNAEGK